MRVLVGMSILMLQVLTTMQIVSKREQVHRECEKMLAKRLWEATIDKTALRIDNINGADPTNKNERCETNSPGLNLTKAQKAC